jgi:hypothetical protein
MRKSFIAASFALCVLFGTFARANIIWNWSAFGGNESGTFTSTGSDASPLAAGNYTIIDVAITSSLELPTGSISGGQYIAGLRLLPPAPTSSPGTAPPFQTSTRQAILAA